MPEFLDVFGKIITPGDFLIIGAGRGVIFGKVLRYSGTGKSLIVEQNYFNSTRKTFVPIFSYMVVDHNKSAMSIKVDESQLQAFIT